MSCGGGSCTCGGGAGATATAPAAAPVVAAINGITLHEPGEALAPEDLRERAWAELLRQQAVRQGLLPRHADLASPGVSIGDEAVLQRMLDAEVPLRQPDEAECARYYAAHKARFRQGRRLRARHVLFAVTPGVDVPALAARAEQALREVLRPDAGPGRFAELARELSNCPSGAEGGELGWIAPEEVAEELARELFGETEPTGMIPRLVHSRYGFHVLEVLERQPGREVAFDEVRERIAIDLAQQARATALHQYIRMLAGQAVVEGMELEAADSPLMQ
ncbi:MAG: putative peptidyl-prolyl cis-trans isomerase, PpiC-type [Ramlibacter sp.]|jgi:peptidyl-prolyl cis-trans isomerase C|nr:putative peptidyl-prolyl cis-trans isomerase, PpiC-type [Ramlibacter sp.]